MNIVLLGIQGSGKGTVVNNLKKHMDFALVSVGSLLREEVASGSPLGRQIKEKMENGELVELPYVMSAVKNKLKACASDIVIFDGFPRSDEQADALDEICKVDKVIYLNLKKEIAIDRILNRLNCTKCGHISDRKTSPDMICPKCGTKLVVRSDDTVETVNKRFEQYYSETYPLIERYKSRGVLYEIDASKTPDEVLADVMKVIK